MKYLVPTLAFGLLISCTNQSESYVFRNGDRPTYSKLVKVDELATLGDGNITLIDVRLTEDLAKNPKLIDGATHYDPETITEWADKIPKNKPVVVYCVKGKWVSQKAATYLSNQGYDVYSLDGGINAWSATKSE